ncbi:putative lipid II flippase FtsW [Sinomonas mesophila]|uniref:putative lipid II flippase FtsW n=1 Tax=Sinomonas mesophila TaxID=1531955 RepID=UPI0009849971|nr:putative lipid II flippase FtsW [Sinomonas mesophila]
MAGTAQRERPATPLRRLADLWLRIAQTEKASSGASYYLILGSTLALTAIGILMVLSASSVENIAAGESPYSAALKQGIMGAGGLVLMAVLSRINVRWLKRLAWPALLLAVALLGLVQVPGIGKSVLGNRNWIEIAGFTFQPSEAAKLALALWLATVLTAKAPLLASWKHALVPAVPAGFGVIGLILWGEDLGTALVVMMIVAAALFFAGVSGRFFAVAGLVLAAGAAVLALTSPNRMCRITSWVGQKCAGADSEQISFQSTQGLFALAEGGWLGVGLGQSRLKYNWLPEAHNDYIFAIIGEELGFVGALVVVALFAVLAVAIYRVVGRQHDVFPRILGGTIMVWILGQATMNMGVVTGLLPVIGVPLPFISYGGSALVMTLGGIGVVLSLAREELEASPRRRLFGSAPRRRLLSPRGTQGPARPKAGTEPARAGAARGPGATAAAAPERHGTGTRPTTGQRRVPRPPAKNRKAV